MMSVSFADLVGAGVLQVSDGYRAKNSELGGHGPIFLRGAYLQDQGFVLNAPDRFKEVDPTRFGAKVARVGDTIVTTKGNSTGRVGFVDAQVAGSVYSPHLSFWRSLDHRRLDSRFLHYWSRGPEFAGQLHGLAYGTDMAPFLSLKDQLSLRISLPSVEEQRQIGATLGALDDKIEVNRRMAATLEEMARALYRSWFVDFDPVTARAEGRAPAHMDPATAALFPARFTDDGLPEGWKLSSIYDVAAVQYGAPFASRLFNTGRQGRPLVRIRDLKTYDAGVYTTEVHKKEHLIRPGDIVVGMDGDFTAYTWCSEPALMNQRVCSFIPARMHDRAFVRYAIEPLLKAEEDAAVATTVIHLGKKDIDKFYVVVPDLCVLDAFSSAAEPLEGRRVALGLENRTLTALRDALLPKLMSGELRVREAEAQVEEVA